MFYCLKTDHTTRYIVDRSHAIQLASHQTQFGSMTDGEFYSLGPALRVNALSLYTDLSVQCDTFNLYIDILVITYSNGIYE